MKSPFERLTRLLSSVSRVKGHTHALYSRVVALDPQVFIRWEIVYSARPSKMQLGRRAQHKV